MASTNHFDNLLASLMTSGKIDPSGAPPPECKDLIESTIFNQACIKVIGSVIDQDPLSLMSDLSVFAMLFYLLGSESEFSSLSSLRSEEIKELEKLFSASQKSSFPTKEESND